MSNVRKGKHVFCRLARPKGRPSSQIVHQRRSRAGVRRCTKGFAPKTERQGKTVAKALAQQAKGGKNLNPTRIAQMLIAVAGNLDTAKLSTVQTDYINGWLNRYTNGFSKHRRAGAARTTFRRLWQDHGAPKLHQHIVTVPAPKPRNVTAKASEKERLMAAAPPHLRCWLLLCSDLAIRSGTAATLGPDHFDAETGELSFRTKYGNIQTIPVTAEVRRAIAPCLGDGPFVQQIAGKKRAAYKNLIDDYNKLKRRLGITRKLTPHDLRRTTARAIYRITGDLREAQQALGHSALSMTAWYLQDCNVRVNVATLELAKLNPKTELIQ